MRDNTLDEPAFPESKTSLVAGQPYTETEGGLTKREYFAAQALSGLCSNHLFIIDKNHEALRDETSTAKLIAQTALEIADAMLEQGEKE